jgi:transposase InsO family protein
VVYAKRVEGLYRICKAPEGFKSGLGNLMKVSHQAVKMLPQHIQKYNPASLLTDHQLCGHRNFTFVRALKNYPPASRTDPNPVCRACLAAQFREPKRRKEARTVSPRYNYRWCTDTSCKLPRSQYGTQRDIQRYFLTVDEFSLQMVPMFGLRKSDAKARVVEHTDRQNNKNTLQKVAEHQTDSGKEYLNAALDEAMAARGIASRCSAPYAQWQNGVVESAMDYVQRTEHALRHQRNAPDSDWPYSVA